MPRFDLTILGSNAALPAFGRITSCQVLNVYEKLFLIDCGEACQIRLDQYKIKRNKIQAICISHLHGDHIFGLPGLLTSYAHYKREKPLAIFGPIGIKRLIETILEITEAYVNYPLEITELDHQGKVDIYSNDNVTISAFPLKHRISTYGYFFQEKLGFFNIRKDAISSFGLTIEEIKKAKQGLDIKRSNGQTIENCKLTIKPRTPRSFAYVSDSVYDTEIIPFIKDCSLLYHETTYLHEMAKEANERMHSTTIEAAKIALAANVQQLVIGHYSSRYRQVDELVKECKTIFNNTLKGYDGEMIQILQNKISNM